ncbi:aminotransferase class I/II-fold pyridoxal phosphate-dependent enzyme [Kitasatospora brasiliensis]|uniref:aminotransferase class I/II-fold pyridoxal phosphate-dependent enzyme n=1 Tax=Kitasatospora brasiliensis TaxID=3058040 RepID=UPI00292ECC6C|nr:aminotransferase class I/II-fold pyridoxal phosphate-dependent enzyme [Kitasatospora sp. K002]
MASGLIPPARSSTSRTPPSSPPATGPRQRGATSIRRRCCDQHPCPARRRARRQCCGPHFAWPPIDDTTRAKVAAQLEEAISIPGRSGIVAELEDGLQDYFGVRHAVTTSSGTAALHATYWAARIKPGDEVIVPAWTFHATASPLFHLRAVPVLCETLPAYRPTLPPPFPLRRSGGVGRATRGGRRRRRGSVCRVRC